MTDHSIAQIEPVLVAIASILLMRLASMPPYFARHLYSVTLLMPCSRAVRRQVQRLPSVVARP